MRNHDAQTAIVSALKSSHARNDDIALSAHQVAGVVLGVGYLTGISDEDINDIAPAAEREYLEWVKKGVAPFDTLTEVCYRTCSLSELEAMDNEY